MGYLAGIVFSTCLATNKTNNLDGFELYVAGPARPRLVAASRPAASLESAGGRRGKFDFLWLRARGLGGLGSLCADGLSSSASAATAFFALQSKLG